VAAVRIKICGLTTAEDAIAAARAGADYLGLVFAQSPRRVRPEDVLPWLDDVREDAEIVGVFRDAPAPEVLEIVERLDLDFVQLHGAEEGDAWRSFPIRTIEARIAGDEGFPPPRLAGAAWAELLDGGAGSGRVFDWRWAAPLARERRVFLAGGLNPANVGDAIHRVRPFAVDVSSGVEASPGRKDADAIAAFVRAVQGEPDDSPV
jgi:phosphoribosylanthranilate isomerase